MYYDVIIVFYFLEEFIEKQRLVIFLGQQFLKVVYCLNFFCFLICVMIRKERKIIFKI